MKRDAAEVNFDGLPGPTHHHAGLAFGNLASMAHRMEPSHPQAAARQSLAKMKQLHALGVPQAVLPPHERPDVQALRRLGFTGNDAAVLEKAWKYDPELVMACYSASAMWTANAATVSPSADTDDGRIHFTPANLVSHFHRSLEAPFTAALLRRIFGDERHFAHHDALPGHPDWADEGAANHLRLCASYGGKGVECFVFGRKDGAAARRTRFPARQSEAASRAVARLHGLAPARTLFLRQHSAAVDAGVFHNDVVCVSNLDLLLCHAGAFAGQAAAIGRLQRVYETTCGAALQVMVIEEEQLSLEDAVASYLFNSQLVPLANGGQALLAPTACRDMPAARRCVESLVSGAGPICKVHHASLDESLKNGGGPACLRLRVVMSDEERQRAHAGVFYDDALHAKLAAWLEKHYRDELRVEDLRDPVLLEASRAALDALSAILGLGAIYPFQRDGAT